MAKILFFGLVFLSIMKKLHCDILWNETPQRQLIDQAFAFPPAFAPPSPDIGQPRPIAQQAVAIDLCPGNVEPKLNFDGDLLDCLPNFVFCPSDSTCLNNGVNFVCCPNVVVIPKAPQTPFSFPSSNGLRSEFNNPPQQLDFNQMFKPLHSPPPQFTRKFQPVQSVARHLPPSPKLTPNALRQIVVTPKVTPSLATSTKIITTPSSSTSTVKTTNQPIRDANFAQNFAPQRPLTFSEQLPRPALLPPPVQTFQFQENNNFVPPNRPPQHQQPKFAKYYYILDGYPYEEVVMVPSSR